MAIIGFNFTKIGAARLTTKSGKIQVNNNIAVREIEATTFAGDEKRKALRVGFRFDCLYEPKVAHIQLDGDVIILMEKKAAEEMVKGWTEKKLPTQTLTGAMNHVLERCNVQAIILARDMNLPSPVPLPKVTPNVGEVTNAKRAPTVSKAPEAKDSKAQAKKAKK